MKIFAIHKSLLRCAFAGLVGGLSVARAQERVWKQFHDESSVQFGATMDTLGDVSGDGISDVIVGAFIDTTNGKDSGMIAIYSGVDGAALLQLYGDPGTGFGFAVSRTGDVDGDGVSDFAVGTFDPDATFTTKGRVTVYSSASASVLWEVTGASGDFLGCSIADAGDISGDGIDDLIVGARFGSYARTMSGSDGSTLRTLTSPDKCEASFGWTVAAGGDVDADGVPDVMVSDIANCDPGSATGAAYVFSGASGQVLHKIYGDGAANSQMGMGMAILGDLNGDGFADFGAGAPHEYYAQADEGYAVIASGKDGGVLYTYRPDVQFGTDWNLGRSLAAIGDLNRDGFDDFLIGATGAGDYYHNGNVFLYSGRDGGLIYRYEDLGIDPYAPTCGYVVKPLGDVNGDGFADLVFTALYEDSPTVPDCGSVSAWTGDNLYVQSNPRTIAPNQLVTIQVGQGLAVQPYALFLVDVNGTPTFNLLSIGTFDATGRGYLSGWYGPSVGPITISVRGFALDGSNHLIDSNPETIYLQ